ncbi:MAG: hypothetical protein OXH93_11120, partial [Caldilineaceae bacterium]|nr:hypothetical protein [Caldilineaceae bacterium]
MKSGCLLLAPRFIIVVGGHESEQLAGVGRIEDFRPVVGGAVDDLAADFRPLEACGPRLTGGHGVGPAQALVGRPILLHGLDG